MSSVETTEMKLRSTPTGGVEASHSPYYRRLLSAGYKGFLQGTIGGGSLYGTLGLIIGAAVAIPVTISTGGLMALWLIPAAGAAGVVKGASTFGNIGSVAAINAESADLSEQRRYLLDRYYDLPEGREGDREAEAIRKELVRQHDVGPPPAFFHWKTVLVGAAVGAAIAMAAPALLGVLATHGATFGLSSLAGELLAAETFLSASPGLMAVCSAGLGALAGATIGIDRYYIRKWFDHTEGAVHSSSHNESALIERSEQIARLKAAARADEKTKLHLQASEMLPAGLPMGEGAMPVASLSTPDTKIHAAAMQGRLADIQKAMEVPAF